MRNSSNILLLILLFSISSTFATIPSGYYYFAKNKKKFELKTALHLNCAPMNELEYGSGLGYTWEGFYYTDRNADNTVIDMYSNEVRSFIGFSSVDGMHIEHSFPKSWWGAYVNNAYKDLFHLYPADATTNITKNNLPLGEVTGTPTLDNGVSKIGTNGFGTSYTDKCFEPADEFKGDFARSYFYISTIYEELAPLMQSPMVIKNSKYPFWKPWALDLLLKWHQQDPVSQKERTRIETIYGIQGNRNPFIDYPDLVNYIWGADSTKVYPFPEETEPFLLTPRRGSRMDFGVILQTDTKSKILHIQGININSNLQLSLLQNSSSLQLSSTVLTVQQVIDGTDVMLNYVPDAPGFIHDTILIQGGGLAEKIKIPVKALASSDFITLEPKDITPVGGTLQWISVPSATDYHLKVYQNEDKAGDLIISAYVEGSSWNKALEIFNGTGKAVDLSKYSIKKQSNGEGDFINEIKLSGTLQNLNSYVLVNSRCTTTDLTTVANRLDSLINFNGNDAVVLTRGGVIIDQVGIADAGAANYWGENISLERKPAITHPITKYNVSEWTKTGIDNFAMLKNHQMNFAAGGPVNILDVMAGKVTEYPIGNLNPEKTYTYWVEAIKPSENAAAINTMQLHTSMLEAPEVSEASNITATGFTANWGVSAFANGYLVDVFKLVGKADTTETEEFNNVGASGTPLPTGWSGTASGNYTSTTSSGQTPPSVALKNAGEYIQTKEYGGNVSKLTFMYKFASSSPGSSFIVSAKSDGNWVKIDSIVYVGTSKVNPIYNFTSSQNITAFKIKFNKVGGGNLSLDDVAVTYGGLETVFVQKDISASTNMVEVSSLSPNSTYFYVVKATLNGAVSPYSENMSVQTQLSNNISQTHFSDIKLNVSDNRLNIKGLKGDESIQIYSFTGTCIYQNKATGNQMQIPLNQKGLFLVRIQNTEYLDTHKLLK